MTDLVIYKAVFNNYDHVREITVSNSRNILFTDKDVNIKGWETIQIQADEPAVMNRKIKMMPWNYFDSDYSIYLDGRLDITQEFFDLISTLKLSDKLICPIHRNRGDLYDELIRCVNFRCLNKQQLRHALTLSKLDQPAVELGLIVRDHHCADIRGHASEWFNRYTMIGRDQLAFYDNNTKDFHEHFHFDLSDQRYFTLGRHRRARLKQLISRAHHAIRVIKSGRTLK